MTTSNHDLAAYYAKCVAISEQEYEQPALQADLAVLQKRLAEVLSGHRVLELACGTGYWTQHYARSAESVMATDINPAMLDIARQKNVTGAEGAGITWAQADAFDLQLPEQQSFSACFAGLWWSHVLRQDQEKVLQHWRQKLGKDTLLVLLDHVYVEGSSLSIANTDAEGNTFQMRTAPDGERHKILKNFLTDSALRKKMAAATREIRIERLPHYWMLTCRLK